MIGGTGRQIVWPGPSPTGVESRDKDKNKWALQLIRQGASNFPRRQRLFSRRRGGSGSSDKVFSHDKAAAVSNNVRAHQVKTRLHRSRATPRSTTTLSRITTQGSPTFFLFPYQIGLWCLGLESPRNNEKLRKGTLGTSLQASLRARVPVQICQAGGQRELAEPTKNPDYWGQEPAPKFDQLGFPYPMGARRPDAATNAAARKGKLRSESRPPAPRDAVRQLQCVRP